MIRATQKHSTRNWEEARSIFVPLFKVNAAKREVRGSMAEEAKGKPDAIFDYAFSCTTEG
jgi:hypothetical protein